MRFTEITFKYNGKTKKITVCAHDYTYGDVTYEKGVINQIESLTDAGAIIIAVFQHNNPK